VRAQATAQDAHQRTRPLASTDAALRPACETNGLKHVTTTFSWVVRCSTTVVFLFSHKLLPPNLMSPTHNTASSSSSFHTIINNALEAYEKRTKKNLLSHPLAGQLQTCNSSGAILLVLQQQVQKINQSQSGDEMLTKWLDPTVKVLYAFTGALGEGVGLVCFQTCFLLRSAHSCSFIL
jgi:hypothetical protein